MAARPQTAQVDDDRIAEYPSIARPGLHEPEDKFVTTVRVALKTSEDGRQTLSVVNFSDIYPLGNEDPVLDAAQRVLRETASHISEACSFFSQDELLKGDNAMQAVRALLPELLCFRSLGDGFTATVLAALCGLENLRGEIPTVKQVLAIQECIARVTKQPFLSYDAALDMHDLLESADLDPDLHEVEILADVVEQGVS